MKKFRHVRAIIFALLVIVTLTGAIIPSKDYYVSDSAALLTSKHNQAAVEAAGIIYDDTGIEVLLVTVKDTQSQSLEEYAQEIQNEWFLTDKHVIFLYDAATNRTYIKTGNFFEQDSSVQGLFSPKAEAAAADGKYSQAIFITYKEIAKWVYDYTGTAPNSEIDKIFAKAALPDISKMLLIVIIAGIFLIRRTYKSHKKNIYQNYGKRYSTYKTYRSDKNPDAVKDIEFETINNEVFELDDEISANKSDND